MKLSCCTWALREGNGPLRLWRRLTLGRVPEINIFHSLAEIGFKSIDILPSMAHSDESRMLLKSRGIDISCVGLMHGAPLLSVFDQGKNDSPLANHINQGILHAADLRAEWSYIVPGRFGGKRALSQSKDRYATLAEHAFQHGVKVCIEHIPGRTLSTVAATLDFIKDIDHPNLYLLFDIGHTQITNEDPVQSIHLAEKHLGYIHLNDNNGVRDLHLPLTEGIQTPLKLEAFFRALADIDYHGPVSLEMNPFLPDPLKAIQKSKAILEELNNWE